MVSATSIQTTLTNYAFTVTLSSSNLSPTANFLFTLSVTIRGEDLALFKGSCAVTLTGASLAGALTGSTSTGQLALQPYFTSTGAKTVSATCPASGSSPAVSGQLAFTVLVQVLKITSFTAVIPMQPGNSLTQFALAVGVYDNSGASLESNVGIYSVTLSIAASPAASVSVSGTWTGSTAGGVLAFSGLRVLSKGSFIISVSSSGLSSVSTSSFSVYNYVYTITLTSSSPTPTAYFSFTVSASLKGEDSQPYSGTCAISMVEAGGSTIFGTRSGTVTSGSAAFSIYFSNTGSKTIRATCPASESSPSISGSVTVDIQSLKLKITSLTPTVMTTQPSTSLTQFAVTVGVYDSTGSTLEALRRSYVIALALSASGVFSGAVSGTSAGGLLTLSGLRILSSGTFTLSASCPDAEPASYAPALSVSNYAYTIALAAASSSYSANFDIALSVSIRGEDQNLYPGSCAVTLAELAGGSMSGTTASSVAAGQGSMTVWFTDSGSKRVQASCSATGDLAAITSTLQLTVLQNVLKVLSVSPVVMST